MQNFVVEIGTEELPSSCAVSVSEHFCRNVQRKLDSAKLNYKTVDFFVSPRRISLFIKDLASAQEDELVKVKGPSLSVCYDSSNNLTPAALGWLKKNKINIEETEVLDTPKGKWLFHSYTSQGKNVFDLIPDIISDSLLSLSNFKTMRWGNNKISFVRPVISFTMLYGDQLVDGSLFGCRSSRSVLAHQFMCDSNPELDHADNYFHLLEKYYVIANHNVRKSVILKKVNLLLSQLKLKSDICDNLLNEVTMLVEWPVALCGKFNKDYLTVPIEVLTNTMQSDQKYFPLKDDSGNLSSDFIFIANIENNYSDLIIKGNERVICPRLADAKFFFDKDSEVDFESRLSLLKKVTFHNKLGSMWSRSLRISNLAAFIADKLNTNVDEAKKAGLFSKADLTTSLVGEFPDLQGVIGMHYSALNGDSEAVSHAIRDHYYPRFSGDSVPQGLVSVSVALAEKIDTITGMFGVDNPPTALKDPFALRRSAIGVFRIIAENKINLDIRHLFDYSFANYRDVNGADVFSDVDSVYCEKVMLFLDARIYHYFVERSFPADTVKSVTNLRLTDYYSISERIKVLNEFLKSDKAESLVALAKRLENILSGVNQVSFGVVQESLLCTQAEKDLFNSVSAVEGVIDKYIDAYDFNGALNSLVGLEKHINSFFDTTKVFDQDLNIRDNRINLVNMTCANFNKLYIL